jgi:hypothetical protein
MAGLGIGSLITGFLGVGQIRAHAASHLPVSYDEIAASPTPGSVGGGAHERAPAPPSSSVRRSRGGGDAVAERRTRDAPVGDTLAEAARRTGKSECDVLDLALARSAWKSTVAVRLGAGNARL